MLLYLSIILIPRLFIYIDHSFEIQALPIYDIPNYLYLFQNGKMFLNVELNNIIIKTFILTGKK